MNFGRKSLLVLIIAFSAVAAFSQDTSVVGAPKAYRNFIVNVVPHNYNKSLIGIANFSKGDQQAFHFSFFNWNQHNLSGQEISLLNITGGNMKGFQFGLINFCNDTLDGLQVGLFNINKVRKGVQVGLINYSDTVESGFVVAFLSITRRGFQGIDVGVTEMYPYNVSYKIGLKKQYSSVNFSCNDTVNKPVIGFGFGSLLKMSPKLYFNPDFSFQRGYFKGRNDIMVISAKLTYAVFEKLHITLGPSIVWNHMNRAILQKPIYSIYEHQWNDRNSLVVGFRLYIRYVIRGL